jgi:hypothetical protein
MPMPVALPGHESVVARASHCQADFSRLREITWRSFML